jgi:hypothetical protein
VEVTANGVTQRQQVMPARGYLSQVERTLTFGLGPSGRIDRVRVLWSDGTEQELQAPKADATIRVRKPSPS